MPAINLPYLSKFKVDRTLPRIQNIRYRSSMDEIVLKWDVVHRRDIAGYRILRYIPKIKIYKVIDSVNDPVANSYVDSGLLPNSIYHYRISCFTKDGRVSIASKDIVARTKYTLTPIKNLKATSNLPKKIKLTWSIYNKNSIIRDYTIYRSDYNSMNWKDIATIKNSMAVEYIDYDIVDGKTYLYKVIAHTFNDISTPSSNIAMAHSKPLPLTPQITVPPTQTEPRKIKITWFDPNQDRNIVQYNIYTSSFKDTLYSKHAKSYHRYFIDNIPKDGQIVYYKVTAVDIDGLESPLAKEGKMGRTKPNLPAPTIIEYRLVDGRVIIKWRPPTRKIRKYIVIKRYYNLYLIPKILKITNITKTIFVDKNIKLGKTYKYQVIGIDSDGIPTKPSKEISVEVK
jgi:fibronectin type 3 domain-containing protein